MQRTSKRLFEITGKIGVDDVAKRSGEGWRSGFGTAVPDLRKKYPSAKTAVIQGSQAHKSSKDPSDPKDVVSLALFTERGTRVGSAHIHEDGTFTDYPSRAGRREEEKAERAEKSSSK